MKTTMIAIDAGPDGKVEGQILDGKSPTWVTVCLFAASIALVVGFGVVIFLPLP